MLNLWIQIAIQRLEVGLFASASIWFMTLTHLATATTHRDGQLLPIIHCVFPCEQRQDPDSHPVQLLRSPTFHHKVYEIERLLQRLRDGWRPEISGGGEKMHGKISRVDSDLVSEKLIVG
jgi:hypothetical protein